MNYYAIGDIHGELRLLEGLYGRILKDIHTREEDATIVFIGDYIDRGPNSKGVIDFLINIQKPKEYENDDQYEIKHVFLRGNHEDMMINRHEQMAVWFMNGGHNTAASYGEGENVDPYFEIPKDHMDFLHRTKRFYDTEDIFFVHAGVDPTQPLTDQAEHTYLWSRDYEGTNLEYPKLIVHGHTPKKEDYPVWIADQINLDTGGYAYGNLSAIRILGTDDISYTNNKVDNHVNHWVELPQYEDQTSLTIGIPMERK